MLLWIISISCLVAVIPKSSGLPREVHHRIDHTKDNVKQATGTLIDHIFTSIEQRKEREKAARDALVQVAKELQPYLDKKWTSEKADQELSDLSDALVGAREQLEGSAPDADQKQKEIDQLRDQINSIRYGLKERLHNILSGKKPILAEASKKSQFLNDITGTSSWQTATWLLLGICMLLAVALIVALLYQASRKCKYDQIHNAGK